MKEIIEQLKETIEASTSDKFSEEAVANIVKVVSDVIRQKSDEYVQDKAEMEKSYAEPSRFDDTRMFPGSQLEITRPTKQDFWGFLICLAICFAVIGLVVWVAGIGAT